MKVVSFDEFCLLPVGTIYCEMDSWDTVPGLYRKGESLLNDDNSPYDFVTTDLLPARRPDAAADVVPVLENAGAREGQYDHKARYCVFAGDDVKQLIRMLQNRTLADDTCEACGDTSGAYHGH